PSSRSLSSLGGRLPAWLKRPALVDVALALVLAGFMAGEFITNDPGPYPDIFAGWVPVVLAVVIIGALVFRRRVPFTVLTVVATGEFVWVLATGNGPGTIDRALLIGVYTVAAYKDPRWALAAVGMGLYAWSPLPAKYSYLCLIDIGTLSIFAAVAGYSV